MVPSKLIHMFISMSVVGGLQVVRVQDFVGEGGKEGESDRNIVLVNIHST